MVSLDGSRSNGGAQAGLLAGEQALEPPLIVIPPPREAAAATYLQSPVPVRVGKGGENGVGLISGGEIQREKEEGG